MPLSNDRKRKMLYIDDDDDEIIEVLTRTSPMAVTRHFKAPNIDRDFQSGHDRIQRDYFDENATYPPRMFERRFRMSRSLFVRIMDGVIASDTYFQRRRDATGKLGLSGLQKITCAIRILACEIAADAMDEYCRISESTALASLKQFCRAVVAIFGKCYLRSPTSNDLDMLLTQNESCGFTGMLGSIDYMKWR
ncbi:hypothetical protein LEN26_000414 [Aphanomyces euteiches]|nr:hypothetical protein AeMF1_015784 [Aphanomyces euteiches]KAH9163675.1 hypothetical protein LEN26_000414 [Aphanomyces euteiches]KAH9190190.1 hypothetical protein AeNC1_007835 [Aphanomyces euteiches]